MATIIFPRVLMPELRNRRPTRLRKSEQALRIRFDGGTRVKVEPGGTLWVQHYLLTYTQLRSIPENDLVAMLAGRRQLPEGLHFQRNSWLGVLTNGRNHIPLEAPSGYPTDMVVLPAIGKIRLADWPTLIQLLENRSIEEYLQSRAEQPEQSKTPRPRVPRTKEEKRVQALIKTGCFCLEEVETLRMASNGRFCFSLGEGLNRLWIVDRIGIGALYIFVSEDEAVAWLTGQMKFRQAREQGHCVIHSGDWQAKAGALIASYLGR